MDNSKLIVELYKAVFDKQQKLFRVSQRDIMNGMKEIGEAYLPNPKWEEKPNSLSTYYESAAHRCAYLHKYAMLHTDLLCDLLEQALNMFPVKEVLAKDYVRICSLGSGPGTDIVAFLLVLKKKFRAQLIGATLIDCCSGWKSVFKDIISELSGSTHFSNMGYGENLEYEYVIADLLNFSGRDSSVNRNISNADIVTMVEFVSAAACKNTRKMVKNIIGAMKPGALLMFVDNAAGGFYEMMAQAAEECRMKSVFEPIRHYIYKKEIFCREYCGCKSKFEAKVAVEIWKKEELLSWNVTGELQQQLYHRARNLSTSFTYEDFPALGIDRQYTKTYGGDDVVDSKAVYQCARYTLQSRSSEAGKRPAIFNKPSFISHFRFLFLLFLLFVIIIIFFYL